MADDELVSYWDDVQGRITLPTRDWDEFFDKIAEFEISEPQPSPGPSPLPRIQFCFKCGLPSRICNGSEHRPMNGIGDLQRWMEQEKTLFFRQVKHLTYEEKRELRRRLDWIRQAPEETLEHFFARRRALIELGRIPLSRCRLDLFREILP